MNPLRQYLDILNEGTNTDDGRLARILAEVVYAWIIGDPMHSGENQSFVDDFKFLAPFIPPIRKRKLRVVYRGVRVDKLPADWIDGSAKQAVTSLKPLQSWSGKISVAREFTDPNQQFWTKGKHGVMFTARASALPILFTIQDLQACYWHLVERLSDESKAPYTHFFDSQFYGTYSDLEGYAKQDEVIVLANGNLPILNVTMQV